VLSQHAVIEFLTSDAMLLAITCVGLVATTVSIVRDTQVQREKRGARSARVAVEPLRIGVGHDEVAL
jgi:hypothetical protein